MDVGEIEMKQEKISVIVPVYKVEKYLPRCVESILAQTYREIEVILVDDGSPDRCGAICDEYAARDARVRVIHQKNGGVSAARNSGLAAATGDLICFVDSDDYVAPEYCELLYTALTKHGCSVAECACVKFFDGETPEADTAEGETLLTAKQWLTESGLGDMLTCVLWNKLCRREVLEEIVFPEGRRFEDESTIYRYVYKAGRLVRICAAPYFYRQWPESITAQRISAKDIADKRAALKERYEFFDSCGEADIAAFSRAKYCVMLAALYRHLEEKAARKEAYGEIRSIYKSMAVSAAVPLKYKVYVLAFLLAPVAFRRGG